MNTALPAAVHRVTLSDSLLQLHVEESQLLPALFFQNFVEDSRVEIVHSVSSLQQEVVSHRLQVLQQPEGKNMVNPKCFSKQVYRKRQGFFCSISPVVFFQSSHEVPTALNVSPFNMWV